MENQEDMSAKYLDKANQLMTIGMKQIKFQLKFLGTDFVVLRPNDNSKWKKVFGGSYTSDPTKETDYTQFTTRLLINLNDMRDVWSRNRDTVEVYTDQGNLEVGDELQYTRAGITYRFKIIQKAAYSEVSVGLFSYVLSSMIETIET
ncbi:MAG: hypothetical protein HUJ56_01710 [Erysipelotrichaceae bacterium]|nr:hypothetical protein [Erysipelotrichaceae bacterium]